MELLNNTEEKLPNIHPGEVIREDFLVPMEMSSMDLARAMGIPGSYLENILTGRKPVNENIAGRLSRILGCSIEYWMNLQAEYDKEQNGRKETH